MLLRNLANRCIVQIDAFLRHLSKTEDSIMFDFIKEELEIAREEKQALKQAVESEKQRISQVRKEAKKSVVRKIKAIDAIGTKLDARKDEKELNEFRMAEENRLKSIQSARRRALVNQNKKPIIGIGAGIAAILVAVSVLTSTGNASSAADVSEPSQPAIVESEDKSPSQVQKGQASIPFNDSEPEAKLETTQPDASGDYTADKSQPEDVVGNDAQQTAVGSEDGGTPDVSTQAPAPIAAPTPEPDNTPISTTASATYVLNTNSHKFHRPDCKSVKKMSDKNKSEFTGSRSEVISMGYDPCQNCNP